MNQVQPQPQNQEYEEGQDVVLFITIGLLLGNVLRTINKITSIPYTPMLFIFGFIFGYFHKYLGIFGYGAYQFSKMKPHLILLVFIPILIFQSGYNFLLGYNTNWHVFKKSFLPIFLLAVPGVIICMGLFAICLKFIFSYPDEKISWYGALTIGSILAATDPVAVVSLLKQLGASQRFSVLIEGQSLLNDGSAMVLFNLFASLARNQYLNAGNVIGNFALSVIGGPLLGFAIGIVVSFIIKRIFRDSIRIISLTIIFSYIGFFISQSIQIHLSGILCLVVFSLYISAHVKISVFNNSEQALHIVWSFIQYICQTLLFLQTGVIIGISLIQQGLTLTSRDYLYMFLFYLLFNVIRGIVLLGLFPILTKIGYGLRIKELFILSYGGLRGTICLALALIVTDDKVFSIQFKDLVMLYCGGMVLLTLLINGSTCGALVKLIKMIQIPKIREKLIKSTERRLDNKMKLQVQHLMLDRFLGLAQWKKVIEFCRMQEQQKNLYNSNRKIIPIKPKISTYISQEKEIQKQLLEELRFKLLHDIIKLIYEMHESGQCRSQAVMAIVQACELNLDDPNEKIAFWDLLVQNFSYKKIIQILMPYSQIFFLGKFIKNYIIQKVYQRYDICVNFIGVVNRVQELFNTFPIDPRALKCIYKQLKQDTIKSQLYLCQLEMAFPQLIRAIHTRKAIYEILSRNRKQLQNIHFKGMISQQEYHKKMYQIDCKFRQIKSIQLQFDDAGYNEIVLECPILSSLMDEEVNNLLKRYSVQKTFEPQQILININEPVNKFYMIKMGKCIELFEDFNLYKGAGSLATACNLLRIENSFCTLKTQSKVKALEIDGNYLHQIFCSNYQFQQRVYKSSLVEMSKMKKSNKIGQLSSLKLRTIAQFSELMLLNEKQEIQFKYGGFIFYGQIISKRVYDINEQKGEFQQKLIYKQYEQIQPSKLIYLSLTQSLVLIFSQYNSTQQNINQQLLNESQKSECNQIMQSP